VQLQQQLNQEPCLCCSCGTMGRELLLATHATKPSGLWTSLGHKLVWSYRVSVLPAGRHCCSKALSGGSAV
jgi:hypothetical protein